MPAEALFASLRESGRSWQGPSGSQAGRQARRVPGKALFWPLSGGQGTFSGPPRPLSESQGAAGREAGCPEAPFGPLRPLSGVRVPLAGRPGACKGPFCHFQGVRALLREAGCLEALFWPSSSPFRESGRLFRLLKEAGWRGAFSPLSWSQAAPGREAGCLIPPLSGSQLWKAWKAGKLGARPPLPKGASPRVIECCRVAKNGSS